jgi:hypothetical protein
MTTVAEDNVVESTEPASTSSETPQSTIQVMGSPVDMKKALETHYKRTFNTLELRFGEQILDGSVVEFVDPDLKVPVASGRLRFTNAMISGNDGELYIRVKISDVTHGTSTLIFSADKK